MEMIRKTINIDKLRNRDTNSVPFIEYCGNDGEIKIPTEEHTNFGGFCCNIKNGERTEIYLNEYSKFLEMKKEIRKGTFLKYIGNNFNDCGNAISDDGIYYIVCDVEDCDEGLDGFIPVLADYLTSINSRLYSYSGDSFPGNYIVSVETIIENNFKELRKHESIEDCEIPYISVPILLTNDVSSVGMLSTYEYTVDKNGEIKEYESSSMPEELEPKRIEEESAITVGYVESRLKQFSKPLTIYNGNGTTPLDFVFKDDNRFCKINTSGNVEFITGLTMMPSYDGDPTNGYLVVSVLESAKKIAKKYTSDCYFYLLYNNSQASTADIPFEAGTKINETSKGETRCYDILDSIEEIGDSITFRYSIGVCADYSGSIVSDGIQCEETYRFEPNKEEKITIDGIEDVTIYRKKIYFEENEVNVYDENLNLERNAILAKVKSYTANEIWTENTSVNKPVFCDDFYSDYVFMPTIKGELEIDRGTSSGFESHFRLAECKTLEDLETLGNNFFNI